jgi:hypothetical protein
MPDVNRRAWQRLATPRIQHRNPQPQRDSRLALHNIRPQQLTGYIVRTHLLLRHQLADLGIRRKSEPPGRPLQFQSRR